MYKGVTFPGDHIGSPLQIVSWSLPFGVCFGENRCSRPRSAPLVGGARSCKQLHVVARGHDQFAPTIPRRRDLGLSCRGDPAWSPENDRLVLAIPCRTRSWGSTPVGEAFLSPAHDKSIPISPHRTDHGICTNNVRMQTKRLLLGMEKLSAPLTDEVVHEHTALASLRA